MCVCKELTIYDTLICLYSHMNIYTVYKYHVNIDIHYGKTWTEEPGKAIN